MSAAKKQHHKMAGKTMTGADMVIQVLADEGIVKVLRMWTYYE